jgi:hypothetical protein
MRRASINNALGVLGGVCIFLGVVAAYALFAVGIPLGVLYCAVRIIMYATGYAP